MLTWMVRCRLVYFMQVTKRMVTGFTKHCTQMREVPLICLPDGKQKMMTGIM